MFHTNKGGAGNVYKLGRMMPALPASTLLGAQQYQRLIERIHSFSDLHDEHFQVSYHLLIRRYAEYVQALPKSLSRKLGSLLNDSLLRATGVLKAYVDLHKQASPLQRYAIFSAILLRDAGRVFTRYMIILVDKEGKHLRYWDPMQGPMSQQEEGCYYKLVPLQVNQTRLNEPLSIMIAPELMSPESYEWLTGDRAVFVEWLDLMVSSGMKTGELTYFYEMFVEEELEDGYDFGELHDLEVPQEKAPASEMVDQFLEWLNESLEHGDLDVISNDPDCHIIDGGSFIETHTLEKFERLYKYPNNSVYYAIGNLLGAPEKGGNDFCHAKFYKGSVSGFGSLVKRGRTEVKGVFLSDHLVKRLGAKSSLQVVKENQQASLPNLRQSVRQGVVANPDYYK